MLNIVLHSRRWCHLSWAENKTSSKSHLQTFLANSFFWTKTFVILFFFMSSSLWYSIMCWRIYYIFLLSSQAKMLVYMYGFIAFIHYFLLFHVCFSFRKSSSFIVNKKVFFIKYECREKWIWILFEIPFISIHTIFFTLLTWCNRIVVCFLFMCYMISIFCCKS